MADLDKKEKVYRYPMGTHTQAKKTLSRLTRDLLHGRINVEKYRAACYGLSVLCSLFKFETPEMQQVNVDLRAKNILISPEEQEEQIQEFETKLRDFMSIEERREKASFYLEGVDEMENLKNRFLISKLDTQTTEAIEDIPQAEEVEPIPEFLPYSKPQWKQRGIGAKRYE